MLVSLFFLNLQTGSIVSNSNLALYTDTLSHSHFCVHIVTHSHFWVWNQVFLCFLAQFGSRPNNVNYLLLLRNHYGVLKNSLKTLVKFWKFQGHFWAEIGLATFENCSELSSRLTNRESFNHLLRSTTEFSEINDELF